VPKIKLAALVVPAAALLAILAAPATAATPTDKKIAALTKQVNALQKQVKTLSTQLAATRRELTINFGGDTCAVALLADIQLGTWSVIDQIAQATQGKTYFGQQTAVDDYKNCSFLAQPDVPRPGPQTPPGVRVVTRPLRPAPVPPSPMSRRCQLSVPMSPRKSRRDADSSLDLDPAPPYSARSLRKRTNPVRNGGPSRPARILTAQRLAKTS